MAPSAIFHEKIHPDHQERRDFQDSTSRVVAEVDMYAIHQVAPHSTMLSTIKTPQREALLTDLDRGHDGIQWAPLFDIVEEIDGKFTHTCQGKQGCGGVPPPIGPRR
jgi:hypothetical protein